jgi:hypothetical protein
MSSLWAEVTQLALEATRGTAITTPTHVLPMKTTLTPTEVTFSPLEYRGTLAPHYRFLRTRYESEFESEGTADTAFLPVLLNMAVAPVTTPTTPGGGTLSRLWTFVPNVNADDIKTATMYWGDFGTDTNRAPFGTLETLTFSNDANSEESATVSIGGFAQASTAVTKPVTPSFLQGSLLPGMSMGLWLDTSSAIGTTAINGVLVKAEHEITTGATKKYAGAGAAGGLAFYRIGRDNTARMLKTTVTLELYDATAMNAFIAGSSVKLRVRHNGSLIESALYHYIEFDTYGPLTEISWEENASSNRVVTFSVTSHYDSTLGSDFAVRVQNTRTTL